MVRDGKKGRREEGDESKKERKKERTGSKEGRKDGWRGRKLRK
jgi:hypothetical protein